MTSHTPAPDFVALATKSNYQTYKPNNFKPSVNKKRERPYYSHCKIQGHPLENCFKAGNAEPPICTYCNMIGHMVDKCYRLHGYPSGHKLYKAKSACSLAKSLCVASDQEKESENKVELTKGQYDQLMALL